MLKSTTPSELPHKMESILSLTDSAAERLFAEIDTILSSPGTTANLSNQDTTTVNTNLSMPDNTTANASNNVHDATTSFVQQTHTVLTAQEQEDIIAKAVAAAAVAAKQEEQEANNARAVAAASAVAAEASTSKSLQEIADDIQASAASNPKLARLHALLTSWTRGELIQKNQSFGTPYEIVEWVATNPDICPPALYAHTRQIYYDKGKCDDKHFYVASLLKKMLDMVSLEYGIPISELCSKFGTPQFYQCAALVDSKHMGKVIGKKRCNKVANGGVYCGTHCEHATDPVTDFKRWKSMC